MRTMGEHSQLTVSGQFGIHHKPGADLRMRLEFSAIPQEWAPMKSLMSVISALIHTRATRTNLLVLVRLVGLLVVLITAYSILFHVLMEREGQHHSWMTGFISTWNRML